MARSGHSPDPFLLYACRPRANPWSSVACLQYVFFRVTHGIATVSPGPAISEDNVCGYGGFFATIDNEPVFLQEHYGFLPGMSARIDVSSWDGDDFQTTCSVNLSYVPHFNDKTLNDWKPMCQGDRCDVLHNAAIGLVKAAFQNPSALYEDSMKRLTPSVWGTLRLVGGNTQIGALSFRRRRTESLCKKPYLPSACGKETLRTHR
jgi:hypothetical protein